jgi:hypothetical protein
MLTRASFNFLKKSKNELIEIFGCLKEEKSKISLSKKPWFGLNCKFARQNYRNLKSRHRRNKTESSSSACEKFSGHRLFTEFSKSFGH